MQKDQTKTSKCRNTIRKQTQDVREVLNTEELRFSPLHQQESENISNCVVQNLQENIAKCLMKTQEEKQRVLSFIEHQENTIQESHKLQEARNSNIFESMHQNAELSQKVQSLYKVLQDIQSSMMLTRSACTEMQDLCVPARSSLINSVVLKENVQNFHCQMQQQISDLQEVINTLRLKSEEKKLYWKQQEQREKQLKDKFKVTSQEVIADTTIKIEDIRTRVLTLEEKNIALDQRISGKKSEWEAISSKMIEEVEKVNELMLKEKKKNEELNFDSENFKNDTSQLEISIQDLSSDVELWKNKLSTLQQQIFDEDNKNQCGRNDLDNIISNISMLKEENSQVECGIQQNHEIQEELISELQLFVQECKDVKHAFNNIEESYFKKQKDTAELQAQSQQLQMDHEILNSQYKSKIEALNKEIELKKSDLSDADCELTQDKLTTENLESSIQENCTAISNLKQQVEIMKQKIFSESKQVETLENETTAWSERKLKTKEKLIQTQANLNELQESLAVENQNHEDYRLQATREKRELEQEFTNVQRELQNSVNNSEWILQQTVTCVEECKQNYAKHVKEKDIVLTALKSEHQAILKELQEATKQKDKVMTEGKEKLTVLEDSRKELEQQLEMKKQKIRSKPKDVGDGKRLSTHSILKPTGMSKVLGKKVMFDGFSSGGSQVSLDEAEKVAKYLSEREEIHDASLQKKKIKGDASKRYSRQKGISLTREGKETIEDFRSFDGN